MNDDDITKTAHLLGQLDPGFLPYPIFEQIARLVTLPIIEFIPFRSINGEAHVLLIHRPDEDPFWPGMLHTPGTVIRATDINQISENWAAFARILHDELNDTPVGNPHYVGSLLHKSKRGTEQAQLYWVEVVADTPKVGQFYPISNLPEGLIESQQLFIAEAAKHFLRAKAPIS
jgi:hypothetical protein